MSSTRGRHEREARLVELVGADDGLGLVALAHRDEHGAAFGEPGACGELALEERLAEVTAHAHHFARRAHFRPEDRVDAEELGEREDGLLDAHVARRHLEVHALFGERLARHYACGDGGDGVARGLGDERHRAGGARIHFKDVDDGVFGVRVLDGELHVHEAHHVERLGHEFRLALDLLDHDGGKAVGRQRAGGVARVHAGLFDVFHHAGDLDLMTVGHGVDVHFNSVVKEAVEKYGAFVGDRHGLLHVALQGFGRVHDVHGAAAEHVGRTHDERIADFSGEPDGVLLGPAFIVVSIT